MEGDITAFSGTSLTINVTSASNTGNTYASWSFSITGIFGVPGDSGSSGTSGVSITGPTGATGADGSGGSSTLYNTVSRYQAYVNSDIELYIVSSATVNTGLSWTRSATTLTITHTNHGRANGDLVIVRNANADNFTGTITLIDTNSFSLTTANSGAASGSSAAYSLGFTASTATASALTIAAPGAGDSQLLSLLYATGARTGTTLTITVPQSATNGSGANTTGQNAFFPIFAVRTISTGAIQGAGVTLATVSNFNVYNFTVMNSTNSNLVRLDF